MLPAGRTGSLGNEGRPGVSRFHSRRSVDLLAANLRTCADRFWLSFLFASPVLRSFYSGVFVAVSCGDFSACTVARRVVAADLSLVTSLISSESCSRRLEAACCARRNSKLVF